MPGQAWGATGTSPLLVPGTGTPALSSWDSGCRQDGAVVGRSCSNPAPERHGVKSSTRRPPCLGLCSLLMQEQPPRHNPPVCYPPTSSPALRNTARGCLGILTGQRQTLPNTARGLLRKAVGTPALIKVGRCINCWIHQRLLN